MSVDVGSQCFFKHPHESWVVACVTGRNPKGYVVKTADAERKCVGEEFEGVKEEHVALCREDLLNEQPDDLLGLTMLHDAPLLRCLYLRYFRDVIYTNIGAIVVALNPFNFSIPWYQDTKMKDYLQEGPVIERNLPHSWSQAHNTYHEMVADRTNQCILVSGESGAGKTEATKIVMKYLAQVSCIHGTDEEKRQGMRVGARLNASSPILECFGNARTIRNDNSSRFGKFMKVKFNEKCQLVGAETTKYLLEKSRIVTAAENERVYHSFYLLVRGTMGKMLHLEDETKYKSLNAGNCLQNSEYNSAQDFKTVVDAMKEIGMREDEVQSVWSCVGGILSLLNVNFEVDGEGARVQKSTEKYVKDAVRLWRIDEETLRKELVTTTLLVQKTETVKLLRPNLAVDVRDALTKALYNGLFGWLVEKSNQLCDVFSAGNWIGLLDIFGFEDFTKNSFEQLCINLTNETLQNHYNKYVFEKDMVECRAEGIDVTEVKCPDNLPCLQLIMDKGGIFALLDEECTLGKGSEVEFLEKVNQAHTGKNPFFEKKKVSRDTFIIHHYAASVTYDVNGWLEKNRDTLKDKMKAMMRTSQDSLIRELLEAPLPPETRSRRLSVGSSFKEQLTALMVIINGTNPHWIRCIKPHPAKKPLMLDGVQTMNQLESCGVLGTVRIRKAGYPVRNLFEKFNKRYKVIVGDKAVGKSGCELVKVILTVCALDHKNMAQVGMTKVFMKADAFSVIERQRSEALVKFCHRIQNCGRGYLSRLRTNHNNCERKCRLLATLLTEGYRSCLRRSAELREAKARWRKEQKELLCQQISGLYEAAEQEKKQLFAEMLQSLQSMHAVFMERIQMLKEYSLQMQKERQSLMDKYLAIREAMLRETSVYVDELRHLYHQERVLFFAILLADLEEVEFKRRCGICSVERSERDRLWRSYRSRYVMQEIVLLMKDAMAWRATIESAEVLQRDEIMQRRALEQRNRSYMKSFARQMQDVEVVVRQLTRQRKQFEVGRGKQLLELQEMRASEARELQSRLHSTTLHSSDTPVKKNCSVSSSLHRVHSPGGRWSSPTVRFSPLQEMQQQVGSRAALLDGEISARCSMGSLPETPGYCADAAPAATWAALPHRTGASCPRALSNSSLSHHKWAGFWNFGGVRCSASPPVAEEERISLPFSYYNAGTNTNTAFPITHSSPYRSALSLKSDSSPRVVPCQPSPQEVKLILHGTSPRTAAPSGPHYKRSKRWV